MSYDSDYDLNTAQSHAGTFVARCVMVYPKSGVRGQPSGPYSRYHHHDGAFFPESEGWFEEGYEHGRFRYWGFKSHKLRKVICDLRGDELWRGEGEGLVAASAWTCPVGDELRGLGEGQHTSRHDNGKEATTGKIVRGVAEGTWRWYDRRGEEAFRARFKRGALVEPR